MIRYDIYVKGKLYRSTYDERKIPDILLPFQEGEYEVKEFQLF